MIRCMLLLGIMDLWKYILKGKINRIIMQNRNKLTIKGIINNKYK